MANHRAMLTGLALLACVASANSRLAAWSDEGHEIVCAIAYKLLPQADQQELDRLARLYVDPDQVRFQYFTRSCTFPDTARDRARDAEKGKAPAKWKKFSKYEQWHYLNLPRTAKVVSSASCSACVFRGIADHGAILANHTLPDTQRAEALFFLGHWVGDLHQPLHVSYADDQGGNLITPIKGDFYGDKKLHGVWDNGIPARARGNTGWWTYAGTLRDAITPQLQQQWSAIPIKDWAQESYDITIQPETQYCRIAGNKCASINQNGRTLTIEYQNTFGRVAQLRFQQAGARLATLIAKALHP